MPAKKRPAALTERLETRLTREERKAVEREADELGMTASGWLRLAAKKALLKPLIDLKGERD